MQFKAIAKYIKTSPFKLRPIVDVIRGKNVQFAIDWLTVYPALKAASIRKLVQSAAANAKNLQEIEANDLKVVEIKVDQGPTFKYVKPGSMGRSRVLRKRLSHITVVLEPISQK